MARIIRGPGVNSMSGDWAAALFHMIPTIKIANISIFIDKLLDDFHIVRLRTVPRVGSARLPELFMRRTPYDAERRQAGYCSTEKQPCQPSALE
jgi:hypothetical protein